MGAYEVVKSEKTYRGRIIDVVQDEITLPDGKTAIREVVQHCEASAIVPVDPEGNIIFVRQYRHPAKQMVLEVPAGVFEKGEDPMVCASRELEEETGYKSDKLTLLTSIYSAIGFCDEIIHIYLAEDLQIGETNFDEDEFISIEKYSVAKAVEMIFNGEIIDSKTMIAILAYKEYAANPNLKKLD